MTDTLTCRGVGECLTHCQVHQSADGDYADPRPYLAIHGAEIPVRDQNQSLNFYVEKLGFRVVVDCQISAGYRCVAISPPDHSTVLVLVKASRDSREKSPDLGRRTGLTLVTDDIAEKFQQWSARGVHFRETPRTVPWGIHAIFDDIDGNQFNLLQSSWLIDVLNAERRLAERRQQSERRAAYEMEIAKRIQTQLFPQRLPSLKTLKYAGACSQARQIGGDYYDFLDLAPGHLGLVIGDAAGKGISGALLMAILQASLRCQNALALGNLPRLLESVNQLLYENTPEGIYATLFFGEYQDTTRRLHYVNCGHLPPILLRQDGALERLDSNSTVLGMFGHWECAEAEKELTPGDTLLLYTDGVTEAINGEGREFGERRLIEALQTGHHLPIDCLLKGMLEQVSRFGTREQEDDIALVVARCHSVND